MNVIERYKAWNFWWISDLCRNLDWYDINSNEQESFILHPGETKTFLSLTAFPTNIENNG
ncbi:hypothetical protein [Desulfosporosinus acididurans]|uniref:hypothetical protein n=1 Tax=Desulfosporosinus acididurans TaxID=476652 RepID=UPI00128E36AA|nr:hypothetical protein [Desulfosporosinus acididurans]